MRPLPRFVLMLAACFLGSFAGSALFAPKSLVAESNDKSVRTLNLYNDQGERIGLLGPGRAGQGTFFLFNADGQLRLQGGTYDSGLEKDQSLLGLHDRKGELRMLFRLHNEADSPTLVLKDRYGIDKMIIGLRGETETPYLSYMDASGRMRELLP